jgi:hypothetical protein
VSNNPNLPAVVTAPPAYLAPVYSMSDVQAMATAIVKGGLFPQFKTPEQAISLMLLCQAKGLHPMQAVERYDLVQGRPAMKAQAMQAAFQEANGRIEWHQSDDDACDATFSHQSGGSLRITWTMDRASRAGLTGKDNWRKIPAQMLRARCVSEGVRAVLPGVVLGIYTPEETEDFDNKPRNITPRQSQPAPVAIEAAETIDVSARRSKRALIDAKNIFVEDAINAGFGDDIHDEATGNPKISLMASLAEKVLARPMNQDDPAEWLESARLLPEFAEAAKPVTAPDATEDHSEPGNRDQLRDSTANAERPTDPFADDEPALLSVPPSAPTEPKAASPYNDSRARRGAKPGN